MLLILKSFQYQKTFLIIDIIEFAGVCRRVLQVNILDFMGHLVSVQLLNSTAAEKFLFVVVQLLSCVWFLVSPWTAAHQVSLSFAIFRNLLRLRSIELVMPSNHLFLCRPRLLLPSIFPSIRWPKYWSFSFNISPSNEYSGLISFRMDWFDLLAVQGTLKSLLQHHSSKASVLLVLSLLYGPVLTWVQDYWKNHKSCYRQYISKWAGLCSSKILLVDADFLKLLGVMQYC